MYVGLTHIFMTLLLGVLAVSLPYQIRDLDTQSSAHLSLCSRYWLDLLFCHTRKSTHEASFLSYIIADIYVMASLLGQMLFY
jgi:hypothetical protein